MLIAQHAHAQYALNDIKRMISMMSLRSKYKITNIRPKSHTHGGLECVKKTLIYKYLMLGIFKETELQGWDKKLFFVY